ncbi:MAG TPA: DNA-3-methyladenine glycosylase 2 family protein [Chakrabartia sp.]|jgi:DNA-3-methyladenine glycosylase II|nr:DNA-3-methyladenine glycosylase 2 family protein [Chakrabartia sp.]
MGLTAEQLKTALDAIAAQEPRYAKALQESGYPEPRIRPRGYETLLRTIVGQQVSFKAAASIWAKLEAGLGDLTDPATILRSNEETLRSFGLSRQKQSYALSLAGLVDAGTLDLSALPEEDEEAITLLTQAKGIGRWSAEIYLLFAEGRPDIWPAGDLAVQIDVGQVMGMTERPSERQVRDMGDAWRPHRGAVAIFAWHHYKTGVV